MQETFEISPFIELVIDTIRNLSICGDGGGRIFLATHDFCKDVDERFKSTEINVIHVELAWPYFRLPLRGDKLVGPQDEIIQMEKFVMKYNHGIYVLHAGFHEPTLTWVISGEAEWRSPLELELARNEHF